MTRGFFVVEKCRKGGFEGLIGGPNVEGGNFASENTSPEGEDGIRSFC